MKVILLERVGRMGQIGDEVTVKDGFARNFLLPQHKALRATEANRARFEKERTTIEKRNTERREQAAGIATGLNGKSVVIIRQAGETGQLYGSVSSRDIADALANDGYTVARSQVTLADPDQDGRPPHRGAQPSRRGCGHRHRQRRPLGGRSRPPGRR